MTTDRAHCSCGAPATRETLLDRRPLCEMASRVIGLANTRRIRPTGTQLAVMSDADFDSFIEGSGLRTVSSTAAPGVALPDVAVAARPNPATPQGVFPTGRVVPSETALTGG